MLESLIVSSDDVGNKVLELLNEESIIAVLAIGGGLSVAIIAIVCGMIKSIFVTRSRENTKRELAAYVAEGTLDPDKAVAIIEADKPAWEKGKWGKDRHA